jgi:signal transduction histidine kinase
MAALAHELRTPLAAIMGFADAMREGAFGPLSERYRDCAQSICDAGAHMQSLIETLYSVDAPGQGPGRKTSCDMAALVRATADLFSEEARRRALSIAVTAPAQLPVVADPLSIRQILINLIANALRFSSTGGAVQVALELDHDDVVLSVVNTGAINGTEADAARGGRGLGLRLVRRLCADHGGVTALYEIEGGRVIAVARLPIRAGV